MKSRRTHSRVWYCNVCESQNDECDGECVYCDCKGPFCKRDNCSDPKHFEHLQWQFAIEDILLEVARLNSKTTEPEITIRTKVEILVGGFSGEFGEVVAVMGVKPDTGAPYPVYTVKTEALHRLPGYRAEQLRVLWVATKPNVHSEDAQAHDYSFSDLQKIRIFRAH